MHPLLSLAKGFKNPHRLLLDRVGVVKHPYTAVTSSGLKIAIRPQTGDRFTAYETFGLGTYDLALRRVKRGDCVIDVGANIGCFAMAAAQAVGENGCVLALEPERTTFTILERNIAANAMKQIEPRRVAVGASEGVCELTASDENALFSSIYSEVDGRPIRGERQSVPCVTLATLMGQRRVSLLKLDCEGAEHQIIAALTPGVAAMIDTIVIEFHAVPGHRVEDAIERLKQLGFHYEPGHTHLFWRAD